MHQQSWINNVFFTQTISTTCSTIFQALNRVIIVFNVKYISATVLTVQVFIMNHTMHFVHAVNISWRICQKQLAATRLMCGANARLVSISTPRHLTLHSIYLLTLQYDYCSVCLGHLLAWACEDKLCFICIQLQSVQHHSTFEMQEIIDFDAIAVEHSVTSQWI